MKTWCELDDLVHVIQISEHEYENVLKPLKSIGIISFSLCHFTIESCYVIVAKRYVKGMGYTEELINLEEILSIFCKPKDRLDEEFFDLLLLPRINVVRYIKSITYNFLNERINKKALEVAKHFKGENDYNCDYCHKDINDVASLRFKIFWKDINIIYDIPGYNDRTDVIVFTEVFCNRSCESNKKYLK